MSTPITTPVEVISSRLILTQVAGMTLAFPTPWVAEILRPERARVLPLPFYDALLLGLLHHNGHVISLVAGDRLLNSPATTLKETLMVIQLSPAAGALANVGIVVDRLLGSRQASQVDLVYPEKGSGITPGDKTLLFNADLVPESVWQPLRWMA